MIFFDNKTIHFVGIGGIGMSAIAEALFQMGYKVQGSDAKKSANVIRLQEEGIPVFIGHKPEHIDGADVVIVSTATPKNNPEVQEALKKGLKVGHRAEMLAELMRYKKGIAISGTHGKTTTTALITSILSQGGLEPSSIIGGIVNHLKTNSMQGSSDWFIAEADESDGSFLKLPKMVSVVTNIDPEHMNFYKSFERMKLAYKFFLDSTSFFGFCVVCTDHPVVEQMVNRIIDREVITYGFNDKALVRAVNERTQNGIQIFDIIAFGKEIKDVQLPLLGRHNIQNALASVAVGLKLGINVEDIKKALASFEGVERRFSKRGMSHGIHIYDDYGHHPVEIKAVLKAARSAVGNNKLLAVFEPHRYTRANDLADEFALAFQDADTVFVADIFSAGEEPVPSISKEILAEKIKASGHRNVFVLPSWEALPEMVLKHTQVGDFVVGLGAGDVSKYMKNLPNEMEEL